MTLIGLKDDMALNATKVLYLCVDKTVRLIS